MDMDILNTYSIPWKGLSNGNHRFDFVMETPFFEAFEETEITNGVVRATIDLQKAASMLVLDVCLEGEVTVPCDRCLADLALPVHYEGQLTVKFSDEISDYDGDIMWIHPSEGELNLAQYLYESIVLSLPYRRIHGEDAEGHSLCDAQMLERFRIVSQAEFDAIEAESNTLAKAEGNELLQQLKTQLETEENDK